MLYIEGLCRGYIGIMERKWELPQYNAVYRGVMWGLYGDDGNEDGNYYSIMRYIEGLCGGHMGMMEKKMETTTV